MNLCYAISFQRNNTQENYVIKCDLFSGQELNSLVDIQTLIS